VNRVASANTVGMLTLACVAASLVGLVAVGGLARQLGVESLRTVASAHTSTGSRVKQGAGMYGNPSAAAVYWRPQHGGDCGEMAVADVVGQVSGKEPTERQIIALAESTPSTTDSGPIYRPRRGTDIRDLPVLLTHYGIRSTLAPSSIGGLEQDLAQAHKVIASVNAETIWNQGGNRNADDHVVVVTGIDANAGVVHLNDSGIRTGRDEKVSLATFERAWGTGHNFAVVTS